MTQINRERFFNAFAIWLRSNIMIFGLMLMVRLMFIVELRLRLGITFSDITTIFGGTRFDAILCGSIAICTLFPIITLGCFSQSVTNIIIKVTLYSYAIISFALTEYFCNLSRPLDQVVFAYSYAEIKETIRASLSFNWSFWSFFIIHLLLTFGIIKIVSGWRLNKTTFVLFCATCLFLTFGFNYKTLLKTEKWYDNHSDFYLAVNQFSYSFISIFEGDKTEDERIVSKELYAIVKEFQKQNPKFSYTGPLYPFEREADDADVLGCFFNKTDHNKLPNFVFIVVEGLGRKLTGVDNPTISFTPFIDSLASNGLFWENCVSTAERTFGALPAIFTSAPHGEKGFANIWKPIPDHNSLLKDFHNNGYTTSFFYGGSTSFDGQDLFMKANDISYILNTTIDSSQMKQSFAENHRWGLDDADMFNLAISKKQKQPATPFADIYLTLTTHEPFDLNEIEIYKKYVERMGEKITDEVEKKKVLSNKNIFACFKYMDESIRYLMDYYKSRSDYANTIFIITGDHRMCPLGTSNPLMKYHVPLIIYSPLLKHHQTMKAVVSHYDITPSVTTFLKTNYDYKTTELCHWIGNSFDTVQNFHCSKQQAFMLNNRQVVDYMHDTLLLSDNRLFIIRDNLCVEKLTNNESLGMMQNELRNYQLLSCYVMDNDYLKHPLTEKSVRINETYITFDENYIGDFSQRYTDENSNSWGEINKGNEYTLLADVDIKNNYKTISCDIRFDLQSKDTKADLPILVVSKKGDDSYYISSDMTAPASKHSLNTGERELFTFRTTIPNLSKEDSQLKIYLWNKDGGHILYDNVRITITATIK